MSFGLREIGRVPTRDLRPEFVTYTDPFIKEAMDVILPIGYVQKLEGFSRSYYSQEAHIENILKYDKPFQFSPQDDEWITVVRDTQREFSTYPKVTAFSATREARSFDRVRYHQGTSAGYGYSDFTQQYPTHKGPPGGANHRKAKRIAARAVFEAEEAYEQNRWREFIETLPLDSTPDIAFTRTQLAELPNMKVRNVFGECFHYVLLEGLFAQPLIEKFMEMDTFYFIGEDPVIGVPRLIESLPEDAQYVTLDWKSFDASIQIYEIEHAFDLLELMLIFPDNTTRLMFQYVRRLFTSRKLASPDGKLYMRDGGVPSGSFFTHIIDSIVNYVRIKYLFARAGIPVRLIKTHGDDGLIVTDRIIDNLDDVISEATLKLWKITPEKSKLVQLKSEIEFLGRTSKLGVSYRDADKTLRLLLYPEYPVDDPQISIARLKGIDSDSGHRVPYIPEIYHSLKTKYGDSNLDLPRKFRRFNLTEMYTTPLGI